MEPLCKTSVVETERGPLYFVEEPIMSPEGAKTLRMIRTDVYTILGPVQAVFDEEKLRSFIRYAVEESEAEHNLLLPKSDREKAIYYLERDLVHMNKLEPFFADEHITEFECVGINLSITVKHKRDKIDSNVLFTTRDQLKMIMLRLAFLARIPFKIGSKGVVGSHEIEFTKAGDYVGFRVRRRSKVNKK